MFDLRGVLLRPLHCLEASTASKLFLVGADGVEMEATAAAEVHHHSPTVVLVLLHDEPWRPAGLRIEALLRHLLPHLTHLRREPLWRVRNFPFEDLWPTSREVEAQAERLLGREFLLEQQGVNSLRSSLLAGVVRAEPLNRLFRALPVPDADEAIAAPEHEARIAIRQVTLRDAHIREDPRRLDESAEARYPQRL